MAAQFCEKCNSIYKHAEKDGNLVLQCTNCEHVSTSKDIVIKRTFVIKGDDYPTSIPGAQTKYDSTLLRTSHILCPNPKCASKDINSWAVNSANMPCVFLTNQSNPDRRMHLVCGVCSITWTYNDAPVAAAAAEAGTSAAAGAGTASADVGVA